uniref:ATP synthase F0 subunit 8 n=1 Tax=Ryssota otaheitana TaxID=2595071 RepID=A0A5B8G6I6_9EUPU|nr:ATP synthase F0 subunit 8 [Ryssota otaheitana]QDM39460.1 ATP synthase F0 subunit 8 [Ryssota otaheitana]
MPQLSPTSFIVMLVSFTLVLCVLLLFSYLNLNAQMSCFKSPSKLPQKLYYFCYGSLMPWL